MSETTTAPRRPVQPPAVPSGEVERLSAGTAVPGAPIGPESSKREPMADLLDKFDKIANVLGAKDPGVSAGLKRLVEQAAEPGRTARRAGGWRTSRWRLCSVALPMSPTVASFATFAGMRPRSPGLATSNLPRLRRWWRCWKTASALPHASRMRQRCLHRVRPRQATPLMRRPLRHVRAPSPTALGVRRFGLLNLPGTAVPS